MVICQKYKRLYVHTEFGGFQKKNNGLSQKSRILIQRAIIGYATLSVVSIIIFMWLCNATYLNLHTRVIEPIDTPIQHLVFHRMTCLNNHCSLLYLCGYETQRI